MAISSKIEEIILEIAKNAGNISDAMTLGVGDIDTPSSAIFEILWSYCQMIGFPIHQAYFQISCL